METSAFLHSFLALIFVLGLIGLISILLRKYGPEKLLFAMNKMKASTGRRLSIVEALPVDAKRKLILVKRDEVEHLILLGADKDTVVETSIKKPAAKKK